MTQDLSTQTLPDQALPDETLVNRFETIARDKLSSVQESYGRIGIVPGETGDRALTQRHTLFKAMLVHIGLLQKMLGIDRTQRAARNPAIASGTPAADLAAMEAVLAEVRQARDDESRDD